MEEKKVMAMLVAVMALSLFVTAFSANQIIINDITCPDALKLLEPCKEYLEGKGQNTPTEPCCEGARTVYQKASSVQNQKQICECLKSAALKFHVDPLRASNLPKYCKIDVIIPPSGNVNCSNA